MSNLTFIKQGESRFRIDSDNYDLGVVEKSFGDSVWRFIPAHTWRYSGSTLSSIATMLDELNGATP